MLLSSYKIPIGNSLEREAFTIFLLSTHSLIYFSDYFLSVFTAHGDNFCHKSRGVDAPLDLGALNEPPLELVFEAQEFNRKFKCKSSFEGIFDVGFCISYLRL